MSKLLDLDFIGLTANAVVGPFNLWGYVTDGLANSSQRIDHRPGQ